MTLGKDAVLVQHILDAITAINAFVEDISLSEFTENDLINSAVIKKLEIIGEASNKLSIDYRKEHDKIPWSDIIGMRNVLIHDYVGTDLEGVWFTVKEDLPRLESELKQ